MGLEGVELVMSLEEAFGIQITEEEATNCRTPRMIIDVVFSKLKTADTHVCRSQRAFYIVRRVLVRTLGPERKSITPDTRFRDVIPKPQEKDLWVQLRAALSPRSWPGLVRPLWLTFSLTALGFAFFDATVFGTIQLLRHAGTRDWTDFVFRSVASGVILPMVFAVVAFLLTRPYCICIPRNIMFIRDVIPYAATSTHTAGWTREEVSSVVRRIVIDQLRLDESEYTEDSRFLEDFKMG